MPLHLILDTGSPLVSVAAARGGAVLAHRAVAMERSSTQLLRLIDEVLSEIGVRPADLEGVAALRGPGSFTGLRIGLATVLGFHQALGIPATALDTLAVLAASEPQRPGVRIAVVDALRGEWTAQAFELDQSGVPRALGEPALIPGPDLPGLSPHPPGPPLPPLLSPTPGEGGMSPEAAGRGRPSPGVGGRGGGRGDGGEGFVIGFGVARLTALPGWPPGLQVIEAPPLAVAAARLAADPSTVWNASLVTSPLYARPPAITQPRPRTIPGHAAPT